MAIGRVVSITVALSMLLAVHSAAQRPADTQGRGPGSARAAATDDYTGYWVSEV